MQQNNPTDEMKNRGDTEQEGDIKSMSDEMHPNKLSSINVDYAGQNLNENTIELPENPSDEEKENPPAEEVPQVNSIVIEPKNTEENKEASPRDRFYVISAPKNEEEKQEDSFQAEEIGLPSSPHEDEMPEDKPSCFESEEDSQNQSQDRPWPNEDQDPERDPSPRILESSKFPNSLSVYQPSKSKSRLHQPSK